MKTCRVTIWNPRVRYRILRKSTRPCGQPVVAGRLCAQHEADRVRLGSAA